MYMSHFIPPFIILSIVFSSGLSSAKLLSSSAWTEIAIISLRRLRHHCLTAKWATFHVGSFFFRQTSSCLPVFFWFVSQTEPATIIENRCETHFLPPYFRQTFVSFRLPEKSNKWYSAILPLPSRNCWNTKRNKTSTNCHHWRKVSSFWNGSYTNICTEISNDETERRCCSFCHYSAILFIDVVFLILDMSLYLMHCFTFFSLLFRFMYSICFNTYIFHWVSMCWFIHLYIYLCIIPSFFFFFQKNKAHII